MISKKQIVYKRKFEAPEESIALQSDFVTIKLSWIEVIILSSNRIGGKKEKQPIERPWGLNRKGAEWDWPLARIGIDKRVKAITKLFAQKIKYMHFRDLSFLCQPKL